jgi:penicillin amidase
MQSRRTLVMVLGSILCGLVMASARQPADDWQKKSRAVLARLDGEIRLPGLKEPVEVLRDRWGVPHIYAKNTDDLFFAQGFVVAQDRLFQIDLWRRVGVGETAEVLGRPGLEGDRFARLMKYRGDFEAEWASYSPDARQIVTAFARGINACIDHMGDRLPIEFQLLGYRPARWQPEDVVGRMSGIIMTLNFRNEIARAELVAAVGADKARLLAPTDPVRPYGPAPGLDLAGIDRSLLDGFQSATRPFLFEKSGGGSNNWAVSGQISISGKPMLASDPHRAIQVPSLRYLVHLHAPGWNVIGSGEPGLPGVALGHNERIAWGITIIGTDQSDWYVEETNPQDPTQYKVGDRWEAMKIVREKVAVKGEPPVEVELRFTRHGPVVHQDPKRNRAYALRWVGQEPGTAAYLGNLALGRAANQKEFLEALKAWKVPALNVMYADVDGTIGWVAAGLTPIRKGHDGLLPVPGSNGQYEWQGFLKVEDYPQVFNPKLSYFLATANHNILYPGYSHQISYEWAPIYRFARIKERLGSAKKLDLEDMKRLQHDSTSLPGLAMAGILKAVKIDDAALQAYVKLFTDWDGVLSVESKAGPLYAVWQNELLREFFRPHVPEPILEFVMGGRALEVMLPALEKPEARWFGNDATAARDELVRRTFARAVARVQEMLGQDPSQWSWGKLHVTPMQHPLGVLGPEYARLFNLPAVPYPGDAHTPNNGRYNGRYEKIHGASYRQVFDLADWDRGMATSVPGQSGQPGSPHYADLLPLWAKGEYFPLAYSRKKVEEVTQHRLVLQPEK